MREEKDIKEILKIFIRLEVLTKLKMKDYYHPIEILEWVLDKDFNEEEKK